MSESKNKIGRPSPSERTRRPRSDRKFPDPDYIGIHPDALEDSSPAHGEQAVDDIGTERFERGSIRRCFRALLGSYNLHRVTIRSGRFHRHRAVYSGNPESRSFPVQEFPLKSKPEQLRIESTS